MSTERSIPNVRVEDLIECSVCGREGQPPKECSTCLGGASVQERHYTLSELRAMDREKREHIMRGNRPSGAPPRIVKLPGSI